MRKYAIVVLCVCGVVAVAVAAAPRSQRSRMRQRAVRQVEAGTVIKKGVDGLAPMVRVADAGAQPVWSVNVLSSLSLDPQTLQLYQSAATILTGVAAVPADRLAFWSAVNNPPGSTINSWYGSVRSMAPDGNGGYLVIVGASPIVTLGDNSSPSVITAYTEQWDIDANNNATFVRCFDPYGESGKMPTIMAQ